MGKRAALWILGWGLAAVFFASQNWLSYTQNGNAAPFRSILVFSLTTWGTWALFGLPMVWIARRSGPWLQVTSAVLVVAVKLWFDAGLRGFLFSRPVRPSLGDIHTALLTCAALALAVHGLRLARRVREREVKAAQLEASLSQARLQALGAQLHPHFLFNTLHAISALVQSDPARADEMIALLAELLRASLRDGAAQEVGLRQELDFTQRYLQIEQTRFGDKLRVELHIEPSALEARVPRLLLQPLVENAIRHGLSTMTRAGSLRIEAARQGDALRLVVLDDGKGLPFELREGVGLSNTRARLLQLYGGQGQLTLLPREGGGTRAQVSIPWGLA